MTTSNAHTFVVEASASDVGPASKSVIDNPNNDVDDADLSNRYGSLEGSFAGVGGCEVLGVTNVINDGVGMPAARVEDPT